MIAQVERTAARQTREEQPRLSLILLSSRRTIAMDHTLHFRLVEREGQRVSLSVDGSAPIEAPLDLEWIETRSAKSALGQIASGTCDVEHLKEIGSQLWESLLTGDLRAAAEAARAEQLDGDAHLTLRIELPAALEALPWEALFDMQSLQFVATHPRAAVVRHPSADLRLPRARPQAARPLQVLVAIPEGSRLGVEHEYSRIQLALQALSPVLSGGGPRRLDGPVTADRLARELEQQAYDIVHFIGHGRVIDSGAPEVRLNDDGGGESWAPGDAFAPLFVVNPPRLVVLNCCLGGAPDPRRGFAGLGPMLLASGVPAVVAMRYEIDDNAAIAFASAFYTSLVEGPAPGSVQAAVTRGRVALQRNFSRTSPRSFVTPLLFLAPSADRVIEIPATEPATAGAAARAARPARVPRIALPEDLVSAVKNKNCVPVVGPGLLAQVRSGSASIAPRAIAALLAEQGRYPQPEELALSGAAGDWVDLLVLARVCQHYERWATRRALLTSAVLDAHKDAAPPPAIRQLTGWRAPAAVCTHYDGLLLRAFEQAHPGLARAVYGVDQAAEAGTGEATLLVHLRGSIYAPDSLVLTEQDHDELWDRLDRLSPAVAELVTGAIDRGLLFLGVSPRDAWMKRLARQLRPARARNVGPVFFVSPSRSQVDEACWEGLEAKWIKADPSIVIEEISSAIGAERTV